MKWACLAAFAMGHALAGDPNVAAIVSQADARCQELWDGFRQFVAEEHDTQVVFHKSGKIRRERRLKSDYYIVRLPSARADDTEGVLEFREVLEADGKPVRRDPARVMNLLSARGASTREEACRILDAANRHNLIGSGWHINLAAGAAGYIHAFPNMKTDYRLAPEVAVGSDEIAVCFAETGRGTRAQEGPCMNPQPLPGTGCIYLARSDYNILRANVRLDLKTLPVQMRIEVTYQQGPGGLRVPARRVVSILHPKWRNGVAVRAEATYSNFRRFSAQSSIAFEPIR